MAHVFGVRCFRVRYLISRRLLVLPVCVRRSVFGSC